MSRIPPPDEQAHWDYVLMSVAASVNTLLGRYVLNLLDADAKRTPALPPADERALADRVSDLADRLRERAARREQGRDAVINGVTTARHLGVATNGTEGEQPV
ncbi:hypothetical protein [Actinophytocola sediminis]